MKRLFLFFFICLTNFTLCLAKSDSVLVCDVKFKNSEFDNPHAGSGFILKHNNKFYGVTAKHVLFFAKTDSMSSISFNGQLKSWQFISKINKNTSIEAGELVNEDKNERIVMPPKGDWLIFEIKGDLPNDVIVYSLREEPLEKGESFHFLGYPYKSEKPIKVIGSYIGNTPEGNLRLEVPEGNYGGCSGGPVLDNKGKLVGIVSMGYFDNKAKKMVFEPASLDYLKQVLSKNEPALVKPTLFEFGHSVASIKKNLAGQCDSIITKNNEPIQLPTAKESQSQLDVYGFQFAGKKRSVELIFADDALDIVWILTEAEEEEKFIAQFKELYGEPTHVTSEATFFLDNGTAIRNNPNEILFLSERLKEPYRQFLNSQKNSN